MILPGPAAFQQATSFAAAQLLSSILTGALQPRPTLYVDEWAEKHRILPAEVSRNNPGPYSLALTPYLRRPMRLYTQPGVNVITLMFGAQTAKTEFTDTCKLYTVARDPATTLVMFGNIDAARDYNTDRFLPALRACKEAFDRLSKAKRDTKSLKLKFDAMNMHFRGSNSKMGRRSVSAVRLFCDEIETYEDPEWVEVFDRVLGGDANYKIVLTSTPQNEELGIHKLYLEGSQERFYVPCPYCGHYQTLIFSGLTWDGGSSATPAKAFRTARYICQSKACEEELFDHHKREMFANGLWVPESRTIADVVKNGEGSAGPGEEHSNCSFRLSGLYSPFEANSWGKMAESWVANKCKATEDFVRGKLGEPWVKKGDRIEDNDLAGLCIPEGRGGYRIGEVPDGCLAITRAIDWQQDRIFVEDRGWGAGGHSTWLINFMEVPRKLDRALADVKLPMSYTRKNSTQTVPITCEFNDSGHFTEEVYRYVRGQRAQGRIVLAVKGHRKAGILAPPWTLSHQDKWPDGTAMEGGIDLLIVNSDYWKTSAATRIKGARDTPKAVSEEQDGDELTPAKRFYLPENKDGCLDAYLNQVTSEHRVEETGQGKKKGTKWATYTWQKRPGRDANHAWDCLCYNLCGSDHLGVRRMPAEAAAATAPKAPAPKPVARRRKSSWVSGAKGR